MGTMIKPDLMGMLWMAESAQAHCKHSATAGSYPLSGGWQLSSKAHPPWQTPKSPKRGSCRWLMGNNPTPSFLPFSLCLLHYDAPRLGTWSCHLQQPETGPCGKDGNREGLDTPPQPSQTKLPKPLWSAPCSSSYKRLRLPVPMGTLPGHHCGGATGWSDPMFFTPSSNSSQLLL